MPEDKVYDDGSDVVVVAEQDDVPDHYVDSEDVVEGPTGEEVEAGDFLGQAIDIDDDNDNGSQWGTVERPTVLEEDFVELGGES